VTDTSAGNTQLQGLQRGPVWVAAILGLLFDAAATVPVLLGEPPLPYIAIWILSVVFIVRAATLGVRIDGEQLVVVSWFWWHRIPLADIAEVHSVGYSGLLNGGMSYLGGPLTWWTRMMTIRRKSGRVVQLPSTISSRRTMDRAVEVVRGFSAGRSPAVESRR
jgi:hypothetical protein